MRVIRKYPTSPSFQIEVSIDAQILDVQLQREQPYLWVLENDESPKEIIEFVSIPTGGLIETKKPLGYIGTYQQGGFTHHLFRVF